VSEAKLDAAGLTPAERVLLDYVKLITEAAYKSNVDDVQRLRDAGWKEEPIAEAVYITALFAFFNRVADAFGVPSQNYLGMGKTAP
jgi:alkylhydroperoxidase family enzyme